MKKILASLLALSMTMGITGNVYAEQESSDKELSPNEARIVFDKGGYTKTDNITHVGYVGKPELVGGEYAWKSTLSSEDGKHIHIITSNDWLYAPEGTPVEIEVEYYDTGNGFFAIRYDGVNDVQWWSGSPDKWSDSEKLTMTGAGQWKTHTFYLEDVQAIQEFQGKDFQLSLWTNQYGTSPGDIYIKSITIRKIFSKDPVKIATDSGYVGNNFGINEDRKIKTTFTNVTEYDFKTEVSYKVCDYDGNSLTGSVLKEGAFEFDNTAYGTNEYTFDLNDITKFGVYRIYLHFKHTVVFEGETLVVEVDTPIGFSVINKPELHERNKVIGINIHVDKGMEQNHILTSYAGFGQIREGYVWFVADPEADGVNIVTDEAYYNYANLEQYNVGGLFIGTYGDPDWFTMGEPVQSSYDVYTLPRSHESHVAYGKYILDMLDAIPNIKYVSMWNEPTHHGFEVNPPENYAAMIKTAYPIVKEKYPDIPLIGAGTAQADIEFIERVLQAGGGDYMDAVSIHPYDWSGGTYDLKTLERNVADLNALFEKYTGKKKPIIIDEMGMHTGGALNGDPNSKAKYAEDEQAASYIKIFGVTQSKHLVDGLYYYDLVDDGMSQTSPEHNFGLVESCFDTEGLKYSAKPGFVQMAGLNKFMWDAEGIECIEPEEGWWLCNFKKPNGENIAIVWTEPGYEANVDINLGTNEIEVFDMYTNSLGKMTSDNGVHTIGLTRHPLYIKGNFTNFAAKKSNKGITLSYTATPDDAFNIEYATDKAGTYKVECDSPDSVVAGDMNGTSIPVETTVDAGGEGYANIKIYNGENLVYIAQPEIIVTEAFMVGVESQQINEKDANHWQLATTIQNSSNTVPISGTCRIIEINGEPFDGKAEIFENLQPGENVTLFLNLQEMIKKRNVSLKVEIKLDNGYSQIVEKTLDFTMAKYAEVKPTIDGKLEAGEWTGVWMTADSKDRADYNTGEWRGPEDLSIDANLMWDEEYLYFGAIVTDDVFYNDKSGGDIWNGDNIQFGIENRVYKGDYRIGMGGTGGSNYTEVGIARSNDGTLSTWRWKTQDSVNPVGEIPNCKLEITRSGNKTYYELAIPWTEMIAPSYVLDPSEIFGFSICLNESDGGERKGWLEYNSGIGRVKNTILFGKMKLVK